LDVATGRDYIFRAWWLVTMPGIAISITVLAINLVASWMRLISDPQEREKQFARQMTIRRKKKGQLSAVPVEVPGE
jgi:peptide/nickel transport system permease protein